MGPGEETAILRDQTRPSLRVLGKPFSYTTSHRLGVLETPSASRGPRHSPRRRPIFRHSHLYRYRVIPPGTPSARVRTEYVICREAKCDPFLLRFSDILFILHNCNIVSFFLLCPALTKFVFFIIYSIYVHFL